MMATVNRELHKEYTEKRYETDDFLGDLDGLGIQYILEEKQTIFSVSKNEFEDFAKILLTWSSMGDYKNYSQEKKQQYISFLKKLSHESSEGYHYEELEVFILL